MNGSNNYQVFLARVPTNWDSNGFTCALRRPGPYTPGLSVAISHVH